MTPSEIQNYVGSRVRQIRVERGDGMPALAAVLDVTHQQVQKYEKGQHRISIATLVRIAEYYRVPLAYFLPMGNVGDVGVPIILDRPTIEVAQAWARLPDPVRQSVRALIEYLEESRVGSAA